MNNTRKKYINKNLNQKEIAYFKKNNISFPEKETIFDFDWGNYKDHLRNRYHLTNKSKQSDFDNLFEFINIDKKRESNLISIVKNGRQPRNGHNRYYDFSLLPLNIELGKNVYEYFIPPLDYFSDLYINEYDPYGLLNSNSRVKNYTSESVHIAKNDNLLGSHKFTHTFLFNIDFYCPIGCSDCYKSRLGTREYTNDNNFFKIKNLNLTIPSKNIAIRNTELLVDWLNNTERGRLIYDIILSGGEPLMLSDNILKNIFDELKRVENLRILRICTGTIFLGMPFRITDSLLKIIGDFIEETNIKVTFQVHLGNSKMISPESIIAVKKIRALGVNLYSQIPIKNTINFFLDDYNKTLKELNRLLFLHNIIGIEPYMFIVDMHPSTNYFYVPLEAILQTWGDLIDSHNHPGLEKPRTLSLLFKEGNIILSSHSLFAISKSIDKKKKMVTYKIPRVGHENNWKLKVKEYFTYSEPLVQGINDNQNSLNNIQ